MVIKDGILVVVMGYLQLRARLEVHVFGMLPIVSDTPTACARSGPITVLRIYYENRFLGLLGIGES
jgi:hypothetical protein